MPSPVCAASAMRLRPTWWGDSGFLRVGNQDVGEHREMAPVEGGQAGPSRVDAGGNQRIGHTVPWLRPCCRRHSPATDAASAPVTTSSNACTNRPGAVRSSPARTPAYPQPATVTTACRQRLVAGFQKGHSLRLIAQVIDQDIRVHHQQGWSGRGCHRRSSSSRSACQSGRSVREVHDPGPGVAEPGGPGAGAVAGRRRWRRGSARSGSCHALSQRLQPLPLGLREIDLRAPHGHHQVYTSYIC